MQTNILLATDSYKLTHHKQYPAGAEHVFSYFESRAGAMWPYTVMFGLQHILRSYLAGPVVNRSDIKAAAELAAHHFGADLFNSDGWMKLLEKHHGMLPLRIRAVPEGLVIPTGNVLMTVENTDPEFPWLTNYMESLLTHVWYPSTVATLSRTTKEIIKEALEYSGAPLDGLPFMLHDFGYRGASSHETAAIGGAAHLVNFVGTDNLPAMQLAIESYGASRKDLASSVPATEHSVMTAEGPEGEMDIVSRLLEEYSAGVLSIVADSYNIYEFVRRIVVDFRDEVLARDGVFVIRPDSVTALHPVPAELVVWILDFLAVGIGHTTNAKGFKVLDPHVRVLWGDGIDQFGIEHILKAVTDAGFSAENIAAFGMGGGLLQKVNRDTQRFAFKASAIKINGEWHEIHKDTLDPTKRSRGGRLHLVQGADGSYTTLPLSDTRTTGTQVLQTVF